VKHRKQTVVKGVEIVPQGAILRQHFFRDCSPVAVSDLVLCMATGTVMDVARIHVDLLPAVVLLATIGLRAYHQQIINDYTELLQRMVDVSREHDFTHRTFYHPQLHLAFAICDRGPSGEFVLDTVPEASYMFQVYEELINATSEELFKGAKGKIIAD